MATWPVDPSNTDAPTPWQDRFTPRKRVAGGCRLNQEIGGLIQIGGNQVTELKTDYISGPRSLTYAYESLDKESESMGQTVTGSKRSLEIRLTPRVRQQGSV